MKLLIGIGTVACFMAASQTPVGTPENTVLGLMTFAGLAVILFGFKE